jgi:histidine triad (HIT) family protein
MAESCIFCKIVRKEVPASIICEDNQVMVFLDIRPLSEGHALVIPKSHHETIFDVPDEILAQVHKAVKHVAVAVKNGTQADGISIIQQNGRAANQDIFHLHVHVIPRFEGQKLPHFSELTVANREKLDHMAAKIRKNL